MQETNQKITVPRGMSRHLLGLVLTGKWEAIGPKILGVTKGYARIGIVRGSRYANRLCCHKT